MDKLYFKPNDKPNLTEMWEEASQKASKKGVMVEVTIRPQRKTRTTGERSQSHCINGFIQQICQETGNDFDDVKMYAKQQAISMGYPFKLKEDGEIIMSMRTGEPIPESETKIDTKQASILIETIIRIASELGIFLKGLDVLQNKC